MGSTEYKRGSRAIARGQWQAPLGSSRGKPPDHGQPAALLASVNDKPLNNEATKHDKNSVMHPRQRKSHTSRMRESRTYGCVSSEGWRVQQEIDLPGQKSGAP